MSDDFTPPEGFTASDFLSRSRLRPSQKRRLRRKEDTVFMAQPRRVRRNKAVSLGNRIKCDRAGLGVFTSHQILPGAPEWPQEEGAPLCHWADFLFLSARPKREGIYFNAFAQTVPMVVAEKIKDMAEEAVAARLTPEDKEASKLRSFTKKLPGKNGGTEMVFAPHRALPSLGGLTVEGAQAAWLRDNWDKVATLVQVRPEALIKTDYCAGVGLEMIVAKSRLDIFIIKDIITEFLARGEAQYVDPPVDLVEYLPQIHALLESILWRWEAMQARSEGKEDPPLPGGDALRVYDFESAPIRM